ncbi:polysaccharide pyruvyl transferase family protein [Chelatococcus sp. YT9]|uniref:polysaccharide pyruvyl transferase family protein n=1 Tax=Chelatococcus sp. YT9 TaxID=2835635 RepID=UPI001BCCC740|nr:polysaccharide pyruvyl transferase family protein [Chelatococcus sp. YT9]MBS7697971.1 polysaccharide pyruvyl transferase family protein [Chelatococcus sp. YT9]
MLYREQPTRTVPYRYYNVIRNCGDAISAYILKNQFAATGVFTESSQPHLLPIGSIFFMANANSYIWGSGVLSPSVALGAIDVTKIRALRGELTRNHLRSAGLQVPDVPLGDPGILVKRLVSPDQMRARYRAAIVPHHSSLHSKAFDAFRASDEFCVVDMMDDSLLPLEQIAQSEVVISQSLHGLVFAEALGRPSLWISNRNEPVWNFKFNDWFSMMKNPQREPVAIAGKPEDLISQAEHRVSKINEAELVGAFPSELLEDQTSALLTDFDVCRGLSPWQIFVEQPLTLKAEPSQQELAAFAKRMRQLRSAAFTGFAEPAYLAVYPLSQKNTPSRVDLQAIQRFMDERRNFDFVWIPERAEPTGPSGITITPVETKLGAGGLPPGGFMIRPSGFLSANSSYAVVGA